MFKSNNTLFRVSFALLIVSGLLMAADTDPRNGFISVKDHGAVGNGSTDDTTAIANAINYCKNNGFKTLFFPNGIYRITATLPNLNSGFNMICVTGENSNQTAIYNTNTSVTSIFNTYGGSGLLHNTVIQGITFIGPWSGAGITIKGTCGVKIRDCIFQQLAKGIVLSNDINSDTFTEYCVAENCSFQETCYQAIVYIRGAGHESFHGSGLRSCTINNRESGTEPSVQIGENSTAKIVLYNAPMDFQVWAYTVYNVINVPCATSIVTTHGNITLENFVANPLINMQTLASGNATVYHAGNLLTWNPVILGKVKFCEKVTTNPDGSVNADLKPYKVNKTISSSPVTVTEVQAQEMGNLVSVHLCAANYDYRYLLLITADGYGGSGMVNILANQKALNIPGYGAPAFSVNTAGQLVITNSNYAGQSITAHFQVTDMGGRKENFQNN